MFRNNVFHLGKSIELSDKIINSISTEDKLTALNSLLIVVSTLIGNNFHLIEYDILAEDFYHKLVNHLHLKAKMSRNIT